MRLTTFTLAAALIAAPGLASAQSVLERFFFRIDGATNLEQVNWTFANIVESVSSSGVRQSPTTEIMPVTFENAPPDTILWEVRGFSDIYVKVEDLGTTFTAGDGGRGDELLDGTNIESITLLTDGSWTVNDVGGDGALLEIWSATEDTTYSYGTEFTSTLTQDVSTAVVFDLGNKFLILFGIAESDGLLDAALTVEVPASGTLTPGLTPCYRRLYHERHYRYDG